MKYVLALGLPLAGPIGIFVYWVAKGCPHADDDAPSNTKEALDAPTDSDH